MILRHATDAELAAAVEENLFDLFRASAAMPGGERVEGERLSYHFAPPPYPMFQAVWRARLDAGEVDGAVEQMKAWFEQRGSPFFAWWTGSTTLPADLGERLEALGFEMNYVAEGMAASLDDVNLDVPIPDGLRMVRVADQQALWDWREVLRLTYEMPEFAAQSWVDATLSFGFEHAPWTPYIGYWNGEPVATSMLFLGAGVGGIYMIATLEHARGRGFGKAMTLLPLREARAAGCQYSVLFASEMGVPMYEKIGFRRVDMQIGRYFWGA